MIQMKIFAQSIIALFILSQINFTFSAETLEGVPIYATGDFGEPTWTPGTGAGPTSTAEDFRLYDDGTTNGDEIADDGIWTCVVEGYFLAFEEFPWKIASPGWAPINAPNSSTDNIAGYADEDGKVTFIFDTNVQNDGLRPDVGFPNQYGYAYSPTLWDGLPPVFAVSLTGDFQTLLGGAENWIPTDTSSQIELVDDGAGFDVTADDGIYTGTVSGLPEGTYEYKVTLNYEDFTTPKYGALGFSTGGGNLRFSVFESSETVVIVFDSERGRVGQSSSEVSLIGPPFYAHSTAWSDGFSGVEELNDSSNNLYSKVFTVAEPGEYTFRIRDKALTEFPVSGDYPFITTSPNQEVLVIFDQNVYSDLYYPQKNLVFIVDQETKQSLNEWDYVQPVGDWMIDFGGATDWNADDAGFVAFDEGDPRDGDAVAGDGVFSIQITTSATASNRQLKAVARRIGVEDDIWDIQLGGAGEGITHLTTNTNIPFSYSAGTYTFQIDTLTGRVGVGDSPPQRPSFEALGSEVSVQHWELY